jgi:hypothetical protein
MYALEQFSDGVWTRDQPTISRRSLRLSDVVGHFIATVCAITQLWRRYVGWSDLALMFAFYLISGLGITVEFTGCSPKSSRDIEAGEGAFGSWAIVGRTIQSPGHQHIQHRAF